jgi:hypothetical protein
MALALLQALRRALDMALGSAASAAAAAHRVSGDAELPPGNQARDILAIDTNTRSILDL